MMDKIEFDKVINFITVFLCEIEEMPIEDFIKELNIRFKEDTIPFQHSKDLMVGIMMIANGLTSIKSSFLMNLNLFNSN